jgi:hypothetical protein
VHGYEAESVIWESTTDAVTDARTWLVGQHPEQSDTLSNTSKR